MYPTDLGTAPNGDPWELDLRNNGSGWTGTFAGIIRTTVQALIENGYDNDCDWFVEVTEADGTVTFGKIAEWMDDDTFTVHEQGSLARVIAADDVRRFRA